MGNVVEVAGIKFHAVNQTTRWRAQTLLTKERDTIAWLEGLTAADVFYDVGANVGVYSLYAGRRCRVYAFEPLSANYDLLNANIRLNNLSDRVTAYCLAVAEAEGLGFLHPQSAEAGKAFASYGIGIDQRGRHFSSPRPQGCIALPLDKIAALLRPPTAVKVDVDGLELAVLRGGERTLRAARTLNVEVNFALAEHRSIPQTLTAWGFAVDAGKVERLARAKTTGNVIGTKAA